MKKINLKSNGKNIGYCNAAVVESNTNSINLENFKDIRMLKNMKKYGDILDEWSKLIVGKDVIRTEIMENMIINLVIEMNKDLDEF